MKKVLATLIAVMVVLTMTVAVSADGWNAADGCKTTHNIYKADSSVVVKDGIIGDGEYREIEINRDPDSTDLMLTFTGATGYPNAETLLGTVHFYMSWDEVNGLNVAVVSPLSETPICKESTTTETNGDEFLFNFGMMFRANDESWNGGPFPGEVIYRGIGKNTETGELLSGSYGLEGYTGTANTPFIVNIVGNTVTYEISFPIESLVRAENLNGKAPVDGTKLAYDLSAVGGGGTGFHDDGSAASYAVSIGDGGYMSVEKQIAEFSHAFGIFVNDPVLDAGDVTDGTDPSSDTDPSTDNPTTDPSTDEPSTDPKTDDSSQGNDNPSEGNDNPSEGNNNPSQGNKAPSTADPIVIAAIASALSACGFMVSKKRK